MKTFFFILVVVCAISAVSFMTCNAAYLDNSPHLRIVQLTIGWISGAIAVGMAIYGIKVGIKN